MLGDLVRNRLLYQAIKQSVTVDTSFLDVGAGTGVWATVAAKLGAKRVVAIEIEECLIPVIYKHAQENGVADLIEIVHANSNDVRIRGRFDVIVSEIFGRDAISAETVRSFVHIRDHFLARGGVLIPQKLAMLAAPVRTTHSVNDLPAALPITAAYLQELKLGYATHLPMAERDRVEFLAEPKKLVEIDLRTANECPLLDNLSATWKLKGLRKANAIAVFNASTLTDNIELDAFQSQTWGASLMEFVPFAEKQGELEFRATYDAAKTNWSVSLSSHPEVPTQNYGPIFSLGRIRMAQQTTPSRRFKGRKQPPIAPIPNRAPK